MAKHRLWISAKGRWARLGLFALLMLGTYLVLSLWAAEAQTDNASRVETGAALDRAEYESPLSVQPASHATHTLFLPLAVRNYWIPPELAYGVHIHSVFPDLVDRAEQMGARWVRTSLNWSYIEPKNVTPEEYNWSAAGLDETFILLSEAGVKPIVTILGNPSWAATHRGGPLDKLENDPSEMVEFMQAVVERYSVPPYNVKHWEFYNEQDNGDEFLADYRGWGYFGDTPELYVDLLVALYPAIKAVDPEAKVVFGGMSYDNWERQGGPMVEEFLDEVLRYGKDRYGRGAKYFDLMNFHYYPIFAHNWQWWGTGIIGKATAIREKMAKYKVNKPVICTEAGMWSWPSSDPEDQFPPEDPKGGEQQSRYVPQLFARSMAAELIPTIWYEMVDPGYAEYKDGLLTRDDWQPKPAYYAYQMLAQQMANSEFIRQLDKDRTGSEHSEAYQFSAEGGTLTILIAWTNDGGQHAMFFETDKVDVVDKWGDKATIRDDDDGIVDGRVHVVLKPSPVYIRYHAGSLP